MAADSSAGEGTGALPGVAPTLGTPSGTWWPQRGQGEVKTPLDVPKSSAGWQPQRDPGLEQLSMGFPWDVSGVSREQGEPLCSSGVQRRQENLDFWEVCSFS